MAAARKYDNHARFDQAMVSNGHFGFNFQAQLGQVVMIEASTNLHQWLVLQTNTLGIAPLYFRDLQWTNYPARFYLLRLP